MIGYWPFCVAASPDADYAAIAAPDFLVRAGELDFFRNRHFRLTEAMAGPETFPLAFSGLAGEFACTYWATPSTVGSFPQTDHAGRALYHAIGFISDVRAIGPGAAAAIHALCEPPMCARLAEFLAGACQGPLATSRQSYTVPARGSTA